MPRFAWRRRKIVKLLGAKYRGKNGGIYYRDVKLECGHNASVTEGHAVAAHNRPTMVVCKLCPREMAPQRVQRSCRIVAAVPESNQARFRCGHCGHEWNGKLFKEPKVGKIPTLEMRVKMARYWNDRISTYCPACSRVAS